MSTSGERLTGVGLRGALDPAASSYATWTTGDLSASTSVQTGDFAHGLLGMPAEAEVDWELHVSLDEDTWTCSGSAVAGLLEVPDLLNLTVDHVDPSAIGSGYLVGSAVSAKDAVGYQFVLDRDGNHLFARWSNDTYRGDTAYVTNTGQLQVLDFPYDRDPDAPAIITIDWLEDRTATISTAHAHHDFQRRTDGTVAVITAEVGKDADDCEVVADALVEYRPDGSTKTVFSSFTAYDPACDLPWRTDLFNLGYDWSHASGVTYNEERDTYIVTMAFRHVTVEIDATTGELVRHFGAWGHTVTDGPEPTFPHHATLLAEDRLLVFAELDDGDSGSMTGAVEYLIDSEEQSLTPVWEHVLDIADYRLGQAQRLDNGNTLVIWGGNGVAREVDAASEVVWEIALEDDSWSFGQVRLVETLGPH